MSLRRPIARLTVTATGELQTGDGHLSGGNVRIHL